MDDVHYVPGVGPYFILREEISKEKDKWQGRVGKKNQEDIAVSSVAPL